MMRAKLREADFRRALIRLRAPVPRLVRFRTWLAMLIAPWLRDEGWD